LSLLFFLLLKQLELKMGKLLVYLCVRLLDDEQALYHLGLRELQVPIPDPIYVTVRVNAQWLSFRSLPCPFLCPLPFPGPCISVGRAVLAVVGMSLLVLQDSRFLDASTIWINLSTFAADRLNRHRLLFFDELVNSSFNETYRALAFLLIVLLEPGTRLSHAVTFLVQS
jgi:hypothetical protein